MRISDILDNKLKDNGVSKVWLSKKINMSYSTLSHKFANDTFTAYDLIRICKLINVELNSLISLISDENEAISGSDIDN